MRIEKRSQLLRKKIKLKSISDWKSAPDKILDNITYPCAVNEWKKRKRLERNVLSAFSQVVAKIGGHLKFLGIVPDKMQYLKKFLVCVHNCDFKGGILFIWKVLVLSASEVMWKIASKFCVLSEEILRRHWTSWEITIFLFLYDRSSRSSFVQ